jgi:hypothetical protein
MKSLRKTVEPTTSNSLVLLLFLLFPFLPFIINIFNSVLSFHLCFLCESILDEGNQMFLRVL